MTHWIQNTLYCLSHIPSSRLSQTYDEALKKRNAILFRNLAKSGDSFHIESRTRLDPLDKDHSTWKLVFKGKSRTKTKPGDLLYIQWENSPEEVQELLDFYKKKGSELILVPTLSAPYQPGRLKLMTLRKALRSYYDITEASNSTLRLIGNSDTANWNEKMEISQRKKYIQVNQGISAKEDNSKIQFKHPKLLKVLKQCSQAPSLMALLKSQPPIRPRSYSMSHCHHEGSYVKAEITLSHFQKEYTDLAGQKETGEGRSTAYLTRIPLGTEVKTWFLPETHQFPSEIKRNIPTIMICTGSGIAGVMSLLRKGYTGGPLWLIYGVRSWKIKSLYGKELTEYHVKGVINKITAVSSRPQDPSEGKAQYVQDYLWDHRSEIKEWIEKEAHFYLCGRLAMGVDVSKTMKRIFEDQGLASDKEEAARLLKSWKDSLRYQSSVSGL
ncbi:hypothetical protein [Spirochaeta cellobiosiphila]|uniref:hypothetical protein n=1 Tax=Spirochaeta cellobiosiphila TaxID=504483 RepID=UPI00146A491F|nr:hypothetical protein [Spirochaeta cellobiosiphila]